jgi:PAS domain S-box-containing protein
MITSFNRKSGMKAESEKKKSRNPGSVNKKSIENIPEINSSFFENSLDAMMIGSQDGLIYAANPAACRMLGFSEKEICRLGRNGIVEQNPQLNEAVRKRNESGNFFGKLTFIKKDGTLLPGEVSSFVFTNSDGREFTTLIIRDITERKKSERELFEFGERYRLLMETSGLGIGYYGLDGKILMFNHQAIINLGGKVEDYIGKNLTEVFGKEVGQLYIDRIILAAKSEKPLIFEDSVNLNGKPGWYISTHTRILDLDGNVDGIQVIADNITERKIIEERIKTSEAEYRSLFENSIMGISQTYPDGRYKRINKAYAEMYGYPDTLTMMKEVSSSAKLYANHDDRKRVMEILDISGYMPPTEFELNRRNGEKFWALVSAKKVTDNDGKLLYLQADHRDITRRKKLEKEMFSASLYARNLIEASLDPLVTINAEGKVTDVNLSTEEITGISRNKLIGSDFADYFLDPDKARKGYKTVFTKGVVKDYPLTIINKSGKKTNVLYNATLFKDEAGKVQGVFAAARDITKLKKIEKDLLKSKELLEKLNQHIIDVRENERNEIALNLHDDLGQKLTAINLDIAWLKSRIGVQSQTVREKIDEMSSMIKETIESIKETSNLLRPAILFDLGLVPAIKSQLVSFEKQSGIKCSFYFRPEEFLLEDRISLILYRILQESMTNIARHSGASKADINLYVLSNKIELIIKDNGRGIDKSKVNSFKSLGIAGIRERVKSIKGKMTIVGAHGSGTMITVEIPLLKMKTND